MGWCLDHPDNYYGDDNARALLGALAVSALQHEPRWDEAVARCLLGNLRTRGIHGYREALELDESLAIAWNGLSMALAQQGNIDEAIDAARRLVELEPDDPLSHTNLSRLLQKKGLIPEAEDAMAIATRLQMASD